MNKDQAVDYLMIKQPIHELRDIVYNCYKDQYGSKGFHLMRYEKPELVSWILYHYDWNEKDQSWFSKVPLDHELNYVPETVH